MDSDAEGSTDEQAGIGRKPARAKIPRAEQSAPGAGIVRTCRRDKARGKQQNQTGNNTSEHGWAVKSLRIKMRGAEIRLLASKCTTFSQAITSCATFLRVPARFPPGGHRSSLPRNSW